jgi:macrolide-specific efflux system membrane fusion protein
MKKAIRWILVLAVLGGGAYGYYRYRAEKEAEKIPTYDRATVEVRDLQTTVEATGEIQPRNRLDVKPPIAGRVEELLLDEGDPVEKGQVIGWVSSTERATLLDAALAVSEKEYEYWRQLYKPTPLVSPLKGTVIARKYEPGQSIVANNEVVVIADDLIVLASLDETDIGQIKVGQKVSVRLEAYPEHSFPCVVEKIAYDAVTKSNVTTYEVDVRPERLPDFARSGMTANIEFLIAQKKGVLALPAAAVQQKTTGGKKSAGGTADPERRAKMMARMRENGRSEAEIQERLKKGGRKKSTGEKTESYVLIDTGDPFNPEKKKINTGISDGSFTEVIEGLEEGDEVLIPQVKMGTLKGASPLMGGRRR